MKTNIKHQTINEVEILASNSNILSYEDFPFNYLSDYRYHLTYRGRLANEYLLTNGFIIINYYEFKEKCGKRLYRANGWEYGGCKKIFVKESYFNDLTQEVNK